MNQVSCLFQASPQLIVIDATSNSNDEDDARAQRLLNFQPAKLMLPIDFKSKWIDPKKMTKLYELIFTTEAPVDREHVDDEDFNCNVKWISELTRLTKLRMPANTFDYLERLPSPLTHLDLFALNVSEFLRFEPRLLFSSSVSEFGKALRVLKLPMTYHGIGILKVGQFFPELRELSLGFFDLRNREPVDFTDLQSCQHLETLTVGVDPEDTNNRWETLAPANGFASLRRLTIVIWRTRGGTLFNGLAQVTQLTQLELLAHGYRREIDISADIFSLTTSTSTSTPTPTSTATPTPTATATTSTSISAASAVSAVSVILLDSSDTTVQNVESPSSTATTVLPRLTTLLIGSGLTLSHTTNLSCFSTVEELRIPNETRDPPHFPLLKTLHVSKDALWLHHYADQITTLCYKYQGGMTEQEMFALFRSLSKMKKLTTLNLQPERTLSHRNNLSVAQYFRERFSLIVNVLVAD